MPFYNNESNVYQLEINSEFTMLAPLIIGTALIKTPLSDTHYN